MISICRTRRSRETSPEAHSDTRNGPVGPLVRLDPEKRTIGAIDDERSRGTAQTAGFLPIFPLVFASSAFVPVATMPGWLQVFAANQPVTIVANTVRSLMVPEEVLALLDLDSGRSS
jgi:hypothetical protein